VWVFGHDQWDIAMDDTASAASVLAHVPGNSRAQRGCNVTLGAAPVEADTSTMCAFPLAFCAGPGYGGGCKSRYLYSHEPVRELDDESSRNVYCRACVRSSHY
jgi:hypothetical protein